MAEIEFDLGPRVFKNIEKPVDVFAVAADTFSCDTNGLGHLHQEISYCRSKDGVKLAYATVGPGPPLVKTANWMNHLEYDWQSPVWGHLLHRLARKRSLIRYDARGNGLSDWQVSLDAWVSDLETVVDAVGRKRSHSSASRRVRRSRLPTLSGIPSAFPISCCMAAMHVAGSARSRGARSISYLDTIGMVTGPSRLPRDLHLKDYARLHKGAGRSYERMATEDDVA